MQSGGARAKEGDPSPHPPHTSLFPRPRPPRGPRLAPGAGPRSARRQRPPSNGLRRGRAASPPQPPPRLAKGEQRGPGEGGRPPPTPAKAADPAAARDLAHRACAEAAKDPERGSRAGGGKVAVYAGLYCTVCQWAQAAPRRSAPSLLLHRELPLANSETARSGTIGGGGEEAWAHPSYGGAGPWRRLAAPPPPPAFSAPPTPGACIETLRVETGRLDCSLDQTLPPSPSYPGLESCGTPVPGGCQMTKTWPQGEASQLGGVSEVEGPLG
ncbi:uncharacterized protein LOC130455218 [Monodelphis domestica]|uniref:uncharacterized protein LOC130455218 n=1 Tax=Monodelphis domestica TaxID=13616 RepID=UPI0024E1D151|nr:uncharacterized protein LOC130455218 [Monodelphis domestica]